MNGSHLLGKTSWCFHLTPFSRLFTTPRGFSEEVPRFHPPIAPAREEDPTPRDREIITDHFIHDLQHNAHIVQPDCSPIGPT